MTAEYRLILLRHGESEWNAKNLFTGWVDVNLTAKGEAEAVRGGELLRDTTFSRTSSTPRCSAARSALRSSPSRRRTATGSPSAAAGA